MRTCTIAIYLLFVLTCEAMAQQPVYTTNEFKPLHGLTGLWKMDGKRGAIYEEWHLSGDNQAIFIPRTSYVLLPDSISRKLRFVDIRNNAQGIFIIHFF